MLSRHILLIRSNVNKMAEVNVRCSVKYRDGKKVGFSMCKILDRMLLKI